jgi:hypothetical protein
MKLLGKALVIDADRGVRFPEYADVEIDFGLNVSDVPTEYWGGGYCGRSRISGRLAWFDLTAELLAAATGEKAAVGTILKAEAEPHEVPTEAPFEARLAFSGAVPLSELVVGDDNRPLRRVAAAPGPDDYVADGARLSFSAARAGSYVYVDYFHAAAEEGRTLVLNPFGTPREFKLLATLKLGDADDTRYDRELVLAAGRCRHVGPLSGGSRPGEFGSFGFEFVAENRAAGDVVVHFP